jgi:hypothetical protein
VEKAAEHVRHLKEMTKGSRGSGILAHAAVSFMLGCCAQKMGWWKLPQSKDQSTSWETVELIALMNLAPGMRTFVLAFLAIRISDGPIFQIDKKAVEAEIVLN